MDKQYRKVLKNLHDLVDDYEDVTVENQVLNHENKELEKDVEYIADEHNKTVDGIRNLCNGTRAYRIKRGIRNVERYDTYDDELEDDEYIYKRVKKAKKDDDEYIYKKVKKAKRVYDDEEDDEVFDMNKFMVNLMKSLNSLKWKFVFMVALIIVVMLAIGASPSNVISWKAFTDLYIEFICNPATMAMAVVLVALLYKGLVKRHKK